MPSDRTAGDYETLRQLLAAKAFVTPGEGRVLRDPSGATPPWLFYGGEVSLTAGGVHLMASLVLERLATFEATQIATYGVSAIPLVAACVAQGGERYSGIIVRKEPKQYGFVRQVDGPVDVSRAVVIVDDAVTSGGSVQKAARVLEAAGLRVEGAVCLVEFSGYGAREWLTARGYRLETLYDVWRDLGRPGTRGEPPLRAVAPWAADPLPPGLPPAVAARRVGEHLLRTGRLPRPPDHLDRPYRTAGGTFISIRRRADDMRLARAGTRRLDEQANPLQNLVLAAAEGVLNAGLQTPDDLAAVKFAVSFLGDPEPISAGQIDHRHHALVVRGFGPLDRAGVALPHSPHYDDEIGQYHYARTVSGRFRDIEPHALYRQPLERACEPGDTWPPYGAPPGILDWTGSPELLRALALQVRAITRSHRGVPPAGEPAPALVAGGPFHGVGVSLYADGLAGCAISLAGDLTEAVREATWAALEDSRYATGPRASAAGELTTVVSLLLHRRPLGRLDAGRLRLFYRLGRDTLQAADGTRVETVLAHFAAQQSVGQLAYQDQVLQKAGLTAQQARWTAYETVSWVVTSDRERRMELGHPARTGRGSHDPGHLLRLARDIAGYVTGQRSADGLPAYAFAPWTGSSTAAGTATRILIAITGLLEAATLLGDEVFTAARSMLGLFIDGDQVRVPRPGLRWDHAADAQLLTCLCLSDMDGQHRDLAAALARRLRLLVRADGAIYAGQVRMSADLDLLSGSVLLSLARADSRVPGALADIDLPAILSFYRERFRLAAPWGMIWWHGQAWSALAARGEEYGRFATDLADWAIGRQSLASGAFVIHDMEPERASFLTACVLEMLADTWRLARQSGDEERAGRYRRAWRRGAEFVDSLTFRDGDAFFSAQPAACVGGVRATLPSSELRIDFAGHALIALAKGLRASAGDRQD
jgi:orotate phosphoribosyltransferase